MGCSNIYCFVCGLTYWEFGVFDQNWLNEINEDRVKNKASNTKTINTINKIKQIGEYSNEPIGKYLNEPIYMSNFIFTQSNKEYNFSFTLHTFIEQLNKIVSLLVP